MKVPIKRNGLSKSKIYRIRQLEPLHEVRMVEKRIELYMRASLSFQRLLGKDMGWQSAEGEYYSFDIVHMVPNSPATANQPS